MSLKCFLDNEKLSVALIKREIPTIMHNYAGIYFHIVGEEFCFPTTLQKRKWLQNNRTIKKWKLWLQNKPFEGLIMLCNPCVWVTESHPAGRRRRVTTVFEPETTADPKERPSRCPVGPPDINLEPRRAAARHMCEIWYCGGGGAQCGPAVRLFTGPRGPGRDHTDHKTQLRKHCRRAGPQRRTGGLRDDSSVSDGAVIGWKCSTALGLGECSLNVLSYGVRLNGFTICVETRVCGLLWIKF